MVTLPSIPGEPTSREVTKVPYEWSLDFQSAPANVALVLLAQQLRELADQKIPHIRDLTCDLVVEPSGLCSLHFRVYR
jgi:hypothetical protein